MHREWLGVVDPLRTCPHPGDGLQTIRVGDPTNPTIVERELRFEPGFNDIYHDEAKSLGVERVMRFADQLVLQGPSAKQDVAKCQCMCVRPFTCQYREEPVLGEEDVALRVGHQSNKPMQFGLLGIRQIPARVVAEMGELQQTQTRHDES